MATALDILVEARRLIRTHSRWTTGSYGRDKDGYGVSVDSPSCQRRCSAGATSMAKRTLKATNVSLDKAERALDDAIFEAGYCGSLVTFNDAVGRTHKQVVAVFDIAINLLKRKKK